MTVLVKMTKKLRDYLMTLSALKIIDFHSSKFLLKESCLGCDDYDATRNY
jgi:hypothetical protein